VNDFIILQLLSYTHPLAYYSSTHQPSYVRIIEYAYTHTLIYLYQCSHRMELGSGGYRVQRIYDGGEGPTDIRWWIGSKRRQKRQQIGAGQHKPSNVQNKSSDVQFGSRELTICTLTALTALIAPTAPTASTASTALTALTAPAALTALTALGAHSLTALGAHSLTALGAHSLTALGAHSPTALGAHYSSHSPILYY
jgi:hypothetical protein